MRRTVAIAILVFLTLFAHSSAYLTSANRWPSGGITMHLQLGSPTTPLSDGSTSWNAVADGALTIWNTFLRNVSFRVVRGSTAEVALYNDTNNVFWSDDVYGDPFGSAAVVPIYVYYSSDHRIIESDVVFNRRLSWDSYRGAARTAASGARLWDFRRTALQAFGWSMGLEFTDGSGQTRAALMNRSFVDIDTLQADDVGGISAIYGVPLSPGTLFPGERLGSGRALTSANLRYRLVYQTDGNLVLIDDVARTAVWATNTTGTRPGSIVMQDDGNLVMYDTTGAPRWASGTADTSAVRVVLQNDGNLVLYRSDNQPIWDRSRGGTPIAPPQLTMTSVAPTLGQTLTTVVLTALSRGAQAPSSTATERRFPVARVWELLVPRLQAQGSRWTAECPTGGSARIDLPLNLPFIGEVTLTRTETVWTSCSMNVAGAPFVVNGATAVNGLWTATGTTSPITIQGSVSGAPIGPIPINLSVDGSTGVYNGQIGEIPVGAVIDGPFIPRPVRRFDGNYQGVYATTVPGAMPPAIQAGGVAFSVSGGSLNVVLPTPGNGTVSNTGAANFGGALFGVNCTFTGTFTTNFLGRGSATGNWSCGAPWNSQGTWNASN